MSSPNRNGTNYPPARYFGIPSGPPPMGIANATNLMRYPQSGAIATTFRPLPRLFALIIGINVYENLRFPALRGAEPDACAFKDYFEKWLGVPSNRINLLLGPSATRLNIIQGLKQLAEDHRIQPGDPIVIFYAGHGGEGSPKNGWEAGGHGSKIQMLVPYDCSSEPGREVPAIPDHTIGTLIGQIHEAKGDNITVIFDCCHSASGTRGFTSTSGDRVRSVNLDSGMYDLQIDQAIVSPRTRAFHPTPQYQYGGSKCHMLLAACGSTEKATESDGHGHFSAALLRLLRSTPPDQLRYLDILNRMDRIPSQNPQCEGDHRNWFLFGAKADPANSAGFSIQHDITTNHSCPQFILSAGSAHGVTPGALFSVPGEKVKLMASVVNAFNSVLHPAPQSNPNFVLNQASAAVQTHFGPADHFRLYIPTNDPFLALFRQVQDSTSGNVDLGLSNITLVESPHIAHLGARTHSPGQNVAFDILDNRATCYGFRRHFDSVSAEIDSVAHVLSQAGHFFRTLDRSSKSTGAGSQVQIEFYRLQATPSCHETGEVILEASGPNLCGNGCINIPVAEQSTPYGFKIVNNSRHRFYAYLFYFDFGDLSITPFYQSPAAPEKYQTDFSLKKKGGSLTIGYGSGGVMPFSFVLHEGQDVDVGFLKLFVSTKPIDLDFIPQGSPFSKSTKAMTTWVGKKSDLWDDLLVPFILRRR